MALKKKSARKQFHYLADGSYGDDIDQFFDMFFGSSRPPLMHADIGWHPAADMYETENNFVITIDLAGVSPKDISLILDKDSLLLRGMRKEPHCEEKRQYHKMEVPYGPFQRVFRLLTPVNGDSVHANYEEGFLTIRLEKRETPVRKRTTITIK
ncbi:Hsp20/alpha crystallin family protein [bacterium]|nr:Hsp20/alpha crystallin family protein [bacterium]